ncbi:MAG: hypothetical protein ACQSGP_08995 [Frankia sp.]
MSRSRIAFAHGARGGLSRILIPSAVNTASKEAVNWPARSLDQEPEGCGPLVEIQQQVTSSLCRPRAVAGSR